ncbi:MAG: ABC transporter ATP-binding protein [Myxococcota bacterium]|jgi:putative ABC transport system ATP-binding protein|nr:ABC transporter ATP-binding protein [Myxococcota bacterium]
MSSDTSKDPVIQVNQAKRHYTTRAGTVKALDGVDLQVLPGEFLAIAGPSGSGKSTLLNLIGALDTPTDGEVIVDGQNLSGMKEGDLAKLRRDRIGFVFQAYNLIPVLSALENVEYVMQLQGEPVAKRREAATKILRDVGLGDMLDRRPVELSGGQQQRVAVARAIAANPAIVLADEPTANLDSTTGVQLLEMMQHLNKEHGTTFVFSTHDPEVMERASRLVRLRDGKIESEEKRS